MECLTVKDATEEGFLKLVLDVAKVWGWKSAHFRPAMTSRGWRTAVSGDGKGFPDLMLIHPGFGDIIVAELKSGKGKLTMEQKEWIEAFRACGIQAYVWRFEDWDEIVKILSKID